MTRITKPARVVLASTFITFAGLIPIAIAGGEETNHSSESDIGEQSNASGVRYSTETIDGLDIFYREAGTVGKPELVLLHGFPTSSHMFRNLIDELGGDFHIIAPDYPGYGLSSAPSTDEHEYTFESTARIVNELLERKGFEDYVLYVMDYGAPVGFRIATQHPERVAGFVVQNGNAYDEGLEDFWNPIKKYWETGSDEDRNALRGLLTLGATKWQYLTGVRDESAISPDNWLVVQPLLDRAGNDEIQLDMFFDYGTNPPLYPQWQKYFRDYQPPMLITWGKGDPIFPEPGAHPYLRDLPNAELHILDTGHFALEEDGDQIADLIREFIHEEVVGE